MNRDGYAERAKSSKNRGASSSTMIGANGMNSVRLSRLFSQSIIVVSVGSARMLRWPRARGPYSMRPWNTPTTFLSAIASPMASAGSSSRRHCTPLCVRARRESPCRSSRRPSRRRTAHAGAPAALRGEQQRAPDRDAPVPHVGMDVDALDAGDLEDLLVEPHVGERPSGEQHMRETVTRMRVAHRVHEALFENPLGTAESSSIPRCPDLARTCSKASRNASFR